MDDLISRAAAKEAIHDKIVSASTVVRMWDILDGVPAVDAAPVVHGAWEARGDCGITRCSVCKWNFEGCIDYKYCPNCGARMDGEANG